jgi:hypothetical protein
MPTFAIFLGFLSLSPTRPCFFLLLGFYPSIFSLPLVADVAFLARCRNAGIPPGRRLNEESPWMTRYLLLALLLVTPSHRTRNTCCDRYLHQFCRKSSLFYSELSAMKATWFKYASV